MRSITEIYCLRLSVESYVAPKGPLQSKRCQRFGHTQRNCGYAPRCVACGGSHLSGGCSTAREQPQATGHPACQKAQRAGPSAEQMDLGEGWNHVVRGGRVVKATTTPPQNPNPSPQQITEVPEQCKVTATRKTARPKKPEPKSTAATIPAAGRSNKKSAAIVKTATAKPKTPDLVVPTQSLTSPLEEISNLDRLALQVCVELTRQLLTSISFLPTGAARSRAVLKTASLLVIEYGSTP